MTYDFYGGLLTACYWVATLFLLKFRRRTREPLFAWFAAGFVVLGAQPLATWLLGGDLQDESELYLLRLAGFTLIIVGVVAANRRRTLNPPAPDRE